MAAVAEVGSQPAAPYLSQFFHPLPRDEKYANVAYTQFNSIVNFETSGTSIIFVLLPTGTLA
jgi:hypothetical protein